MFLDPLQRQQLKSNCYVLNLSNFCKIDLSSSQVFCLFIPRFQLNTLRSCIVQQRNVKVNVAFVPGPWVQRFQQSHRQEDKGSQEAPPCIVRRQAPVAKKVFESLWTKIKNKYHITNHKKHVSKNEYHITLQELPRTSPNVSSKHERPTVDVNLFNKQLICRLSTIVFFHSYGKSVTPKNESKVILFTITGSFGLWSADGSSGVWTARWRQSSVPITAPGRPRTAASILESWLEGK